MIILGCDGITLSFGERDVLSRVSFSVQEGDRVGIVGENGAGKTSLLRVITGEYDCEGSVYISKGKTVGMLSQTGAVCGGGTVYDEFESAFSDLIEREAELEQMHKRIELYEFCKTAAPTELISAYAHGIEQFNADGGDHFRNLVRSYLLQLGFTEDEWSRPADKLSGGQKTRLALGKLLLRPPDILLLDEPTNHLDIQTLQWLEEILSGISSTLLVVSHDRYFLDRVCTKILDIERGQGKLYNGNYSTYVAKKQTDREIQRRHYENQQREIAHMEAFIEQQRRWNREKNIIAAESRQKAIDRMEKISAPEAELQTVRIRFDAGSESGNDVLTVRKVAKSFGENKLFTDLSFLIKRGDYAFITGQNGCGKSTLMKILRGKLLPDSGSFEFGYNVSIGYYDQENQELNEENTVLDELWDAFSTSSQTTIRSALALFLFRGDDVQKKIGMLSGGEKARLTLTKLILRKNNVLLLDEPTNHLDIKSREALEGALAEYKGTVIAVSHDRYFVNKLATRILDISASPLVDYKGGYGDFLAYTSGKAAGAGDTGKPSVSQGRLRYEEEKLFKSQMRKLKSKIEREKAKCAEIEERLGQIDEEYIKYELDYKKLMELDSEREALEDELLGLYEQTDADEKEFNLKYDVK